MLGDVAIAVHPDDKRYQHLIGKHPIHPFIADRKMVVVADEIADPEKGTGAVKITPAHSFEDYEVGLRHKLDIINILNDDGTMNSNVGERFVGMKRFHARKAVVEALKEKGLWVETKDNGVMQLPTCAKSGDIIEPLVKPQWWVNCQDVAKQAIEVCHLYRCVLVADLAYAENESWRSDHRAESDGERMVRVAWRHS